MNPFDFVKADGGGSFMPVVIFIIWLAFSLIGNSQKKKKKRMLAEQQRRHENVPESEPSTSHDGLATDAGTAGREEEAKSGDILGDLRREFETVLRGPETREEAPLEVESPEPEATPNKHWTFDDQPLPPVVSLEAGRINAPSPMAAVPVSGTAFPGEGYDTDHTAIAVDLNSLDEARKGVIWSEILALPKALRKE
jgi:hypothetical protein